MRPFDFDLDVAVGDIVMFCDAPNGGKGNVSAPGLVCHKGNDSIEVLIYAYNGAGIAPRYRSGVRYTHDDRLKDPAYLHNILADDDSGFFDLHPNMVRIRALEDQIADLNEKVFKIKKAEPVKADPVLPPADTSFRLETIGKAPLTPEEKAARSEILKTAV
jgi:hypothetical protein